MVLVALALRLVVMGFLYPEQLDPERDHWRFSYENGRLARSIAEGRGFSSPLFEDTGVSAWLTPVYPYLTAGVFKIFGVYSTASALVLLSFQCLVSAVNCLPLFYFARKLFGPVVATWSGWAWAFFPYAIYFPAERIWNTWLATLLFSILFLITLYMERSTRLTRWVVYGLFWGFVALTDPVVLAAWPFMLAWVGFRMHRQKLRWALPLAISVLALVAFVAPWFVRNYVAFGRFIPFRDTMGMEIHMGNSGDTFHWRPRWIGPWHNDQEWEDFKRLGEVGYMDREKQKGLDLYILDLTDKDKRLTRYYISAKTLHVLWLEYEEAASPGATPVKYTRKFFDYRYAQSTLVPYRTVLMEDGKQTQETRILSVTFGAKVDDAVFENPETRAGVS